MSLTIVNHSLSVGDISLIGIAAASMLQVGDAEVVSLYSYFDTPPESVIVGPLAPLPDPAGEGDGSTGQPDVVDSPSR